MNNISYRILLISACMIILGALFFAYQQSWIIIALPSTTHSTSQHTNQAAQAHNVTLWAFKQERWIKENTEIIMNSDTAYNIQHILNAWLIFIEEEQIIDTPITIQSVIISASGNEAFISFSHTPCKPEASTYSTWMLIESMLKTLRENNINIQSIRMLTHHQPIHDARLNFDISWPITGYINTNNSDLL